MKYPLVPGVVAFLFAGGLHAGAASSTLAPVADTTLFETTPNNNLGVSSLAVGATANGFACRALLRFDVSSIPSNAAVTAVTLSFLVFRASISQGEPSLFQLHRFLKPWTEGSGGGNTGVFAQPGETTWVSQFHGATFWSQGGGAMGTEYSSEASASVPVTSLPFGEVQTYAFESTAELIADVQAWVSGSSPNHGWLMRVLDEDPGETARRIVSREDPNFSPLLQIEYTLPPDDPIPHIASAGSTNGGFDLRFTVPSTYCYEVEFRDSLVSGSWSVLTNICANASDIQAVATDSIAGPQRFYRLRISDRVR